MPSIETTSGDGAHQGPSLFEELEMLPAICSVCDRLIAVQDGYCQECFRDEEPDLELVYDYL